MPAVRAGGGIVNLTGHAMIPNPIEVHLVYPDVPRASLEVVGDIPSMWMTIDKALFCNPQNKWDSYGFHTDILLNNPLHGLPLDHQ